MAYICKITDTSSVTGALTTSLFGTCDTAKSTAAKVVTCSDFDALIPGVTIRVKFDNENTASTPTLNVNSTGAKEIKAFGTTKPGTNKTASWYPGSIVEFMYYEVSSGGTTTGYWAFTSCNAQLTEASIGSASAGSTISVPNITGVSTVTIPNVTNVSSVTIPNPSASDVTIPNVTGVSSVTIPNVTGNTDVSVPNITANTSVTVKSVKTVNNAVNASTISQGILTFSSGATVETEDKTATNTTLGTNKTASKVTLGTALSASSVTLGDALTASKVTFGADLTASAVTLGDALSASSVTTGTAIEVPVVTITPTTVAVPRQTS